MDKATYVALQSKPIEEWTLAECRDADRLIKQETLAAIDKRLQLEISDPYVRQFTYDMLRIHFGSAEVDQLCMKLEVYPTWMDKHEY